MHKKMTKNEIVKPQIAIYQALGVGQKIQVRIEDENVWLTQNVMADLFQTTKQNIGQHIKNIVGEEELEEVSVVKDFFTTAADGKRYDAKHYNVKKPCG
jgi:hypothetical protein